MTLKTCKNIILIGFMGTGKTAVGHTLATRLCWEFIDTDNIIVERSGKSIHRIFTEDGEGYFRKLEEEVIKELTRLSNKVIATGGGAILTPGNREKLKRSGTVFLLTASPRTIYQRLKGDSSRPLLQGEYMLNRIEELLKLRDEYYLLAADYVIDTNGARPEEVCDAILQILLNQKGGK